MPVKRTVWNWIVDEITDLLCSNGVKKQANIYQSRNASLSRINYNRWPDCERIIWIGIETNSYMCIFTISWWLVTFLIVRGINENWRAENNRNNIDTIAVLWRLGHLRLSLCATPVYCPVAAQKSRGKRCTNRNDVKPIQWRPLRSLLFSFCLKHI